MVNMHDKQALRNRIAQLEAENAKLNRDLVEARSQTGEARANARLTKEFADYKAHIARCIADFEAGFAKFPHPDTLRRRD